jgi:uncharacterized protein
MRVIVADIPEEGLQLVEQVDPAAWSLNAPDRAFVAPLAVSAFVQRHDDDLTVTAEADGLVEITCVRCLAAVRRPYHETFAMALELHQRPSLALDDELRQEILLSAPLTARCRDDCRGLCPTCGHNRNEGACSHGTT